MNSQIKALDLYEHSTIEVKDEEIKALATNFDMGHPYGLSARFDAPVYQVTRYGHDVYECRDFFQLINVSYAIVNFLSIEKPENKS